MKLLWWDVITNRGIDTKECADVLLHAENA